MAKHQAYSLIIFRIQAQQENIKNVAKYTNETESVFT